MNQADRIRRFVLDHYIGPARAAGLREVTIRAGDVHRAMGLDNAMPSVCGAIRIGKFRVLAGVTLLEHIGPRNGANVYFRFGLGPLPKAEQPTHVQPQSAPEPARTEAAKDCYLSDALVLVSCVKTKLPHPAPAKDLYTSPLFQKTRSIVEASGARWFVLSALHGLVSPDAVISPYELTLNTLGVAERKAWAKRVLEKLLPAAANYRRIVFFAGARYREFLVGPLEREGFTVETPLEHLAFGEQLAWLSEHE